MAQKWHVTGPPGTGKTTYLARQASRAAAEHGGDAVVITSLTKAAAVEIGGRDSGVAPMGIGTLHSLCFRSMRGEVSVVLDSRKGLPRWNEWITTTTPPRPDWKLSAKAAADFDTPREEGDDTTGDRLLGQLNILRQHRSAADLGSWKNAEATWPVSVQAFWKRWNDCMDELGACDYTGMLETAAEDMDHAPGAPTVLLVDEAQDLSCLEASLLHRWADHVESAVFTGDMDQALYTWRGANPRLFLDHPVPKTHRRVLPQSYRVPQAVQEAAQAIIRRIPDREDVEYLPRAERGSVDVMEAARWKQPALWLDDVLAKLRHGSVMVLAPCAYQLRPLLALLKREGIPFANRYRRAAGEWNPLASHRPGAIKNQLVDFLSVGPDGELWTTAALKNWLPMLRTRPEGDRPGILAQGAKTAITKLPPTHCLDDYVALIADPHSVLTAMDRNPRWLLERAMSKHRKRLLYPLAVHKRGGEEALKADPKLTIGTVHSVKGGEADHVFALTALSSAQREEGLESPNLCRLFYVAATRARESLTWLAGDRGGFEP